MKGGAATVAKNALTTWGAVLIRSALQLVVIPVMLTALGREGYGVTGIVASIVGFTTIADFGLRKALTQNLAAQRGLGDHDAFNRIASSALALYGTAGLVLGAVCWQAAPLALDYFHVSSALRADALFAVRWFGTSTILVTFLSQPFAGALWSSERFDLVNYATTSTTVASGLATIAVLTFTDLGLVGWAVVSLVGRWGFLALVVRSAFKEHPALTFRAELVGWATLRPVIHLGGWLFVVQIASTLSQHSDVLILSRLVSPAAAAIYRPAVTLAGAVRPFVGILALQLRSRAAMYSATEDAQGVRDILLVGTKYTFLMGVGTSVLLFSFAEPIVTVWLGNELGADTDTTIMLLRTWALIDLFTHAGGTQWSILIATRALRGAVLVQLALAIVNVFANIAVVKYTRLGIAGILLPTLALEVVGRLFLTWFAARVAEVDVAEYVRRSHVPGLRVLLLLAPAGFGLALAATGFGALGLGVGAVALGLVWVAGLWVLGFDPSDRDRARRVFTAARAKLSGRGA